MPDFGEARPTQRLKSWIAMALVAALAASGAASAQTTTPAPPSVTVSPPLQKEITEWDQFTGQFQAVDFVEIVNGNAVALQSSSGGLGTGHRTREAVFYRRQLIDEAVGGRSRPDADNFSFDKVSDGCAPNGLLQLVLGNRQTRPRRLRVGGWPPL